MYRALGWQAFGVVPNHAMLVGRHALADDLLLEGPAVTRRRDRPVTVLIAPDSFKGSLTSVEVARALADGWARARPGDAILLSPLADGGEGTLAAVEAAGGWDWRASTVHDPLGRPIEARWLRSRRTGAARPTSRWPQASGLSRVAPDERDPSRRPASGPAS